VILSYIVILSVLGLVSDILCHLSQEDKSEELVRADFTSDWELPEG
jgi:hypothetical protein